MPQYSPTAGPATGRPPKNTVSTPDPTAPVRRVAALLDAAEEVATDLRARADAMAHRGRAEALRWAARRLERAVEARRAELAAGAPGRRAS